MKPFIYKIWIAVCAAVIIAGGVVFSHDKHNFLSFLIGAVIIIIDIGVIGFGIAKLLKHKNKLFFGLLIFLKYPLLLASLYISIVTIKLPVIPFILGITVAPVSIVITGIISMIGGEQNA
ncbi:MAG: hypothetical protein M1381_00435 [Deltaproteobacteria bacterium]|nr:hypothetical protein [Deltaproteobacteria bacterium]MCL5791530.1 hypothetical protein [Deltaproteobacteria bacterium]